MLRRQRTSAGGMAGLLMIAAGLLTIVNNVLPGAGHLDVGLLYLTGGLATGIGFISLFIPWHRLPDRTPMLLAFMAFALVSASDAYGGVSSFSYAIYFVVVFVWIGMTQPVGTSIAVSPIAVLGYLLPALTHHANAELAESVTVAIPVCVLVGEVIARGARQQQRSRDELARRIRQVERLAGLSAVINRELDPSAVAQAVAECAAGIFDGVAVVSRLEGDELVLMGVTGDVGLPVGHRVPVATTSIGRAFASSSLFAISDFSRTGASVPAGGSVVTTACTNGSALIGGVGVILKRSSSEVTDEDRDVLALIAAQADVALVNAETHRALLDERQHEQAVVDLLDDGVVVVGTDGIVHSANRAAGTLIGIPTEELVGSPVPESVLNVGNRLRRLPSGRFLETVTAVLPDSGETVITLRDVTRQHELDEAKDLFLATTSHELRTPLTAIKGYVSTLQRHWSRLDEAERRRALAIVDEQADNLVRLTDHLLLGARAGSTQLPLTVFDLGSVAEAATSAYAEHASGHRLTARIESSLPMVLGDPSGSRSVLAQLIENAVKYSPAGGEIEVIVNADVSNARVNVHVLDRGVGIQPGKLDAIFSPFYQAEPANTRIFGGVGLGLFIVRRLVESQGGEVSAHARAGGGADLRFWLPIARMPAQRDKQVTADPALRRS